jgi:putative aldouronate transport system substrate-binding protein
MLAVALCAALAPAAALADGLVTENGALPVVSEPYTITMLGTYHGASTAPLKQNRFTTMYEELTGVTLDIQYDLSTDEFSEKFNAILASGDYPEMFVGDTLSKSQMIELGHQGIVQPLEEYIDQYSIHLKGAMEENPWMREGITDPDTGHIYGLPASEVDYEHQVWSKIFVYQPWLDKLGLEVPETTEELKRLLIAFRDQDPNGNGEADEMPLAFDTTSWDRTYWQSLINPFIYWNDSGASGVYLQNVDGTAVFNANKEGYRDAIRWIAELYSEKLFPSDVFTGITATGFTIVEPNQLGASIGHFMGMFTTEGPRRNEFVIVPPLTGPDGERNANYRFVNPSINLVITDKMKDPEVAVRWADWFYTTEGTITAFYGLKDVAWRDSPVEGLGFSGYPMIYEQLDIAEFGDLNDFAWQWTAPQFRSRAVREGMYLSDEQFLKNYDAQMIIMMEKAYGQTGGFEPEKSFPNIILGEEDDRRASELLTPIQDLIKSTFADMVLGRQSPDTDWDRYVARLDAMGIDEYTAIYQRALDKVLRK